MTPEGTCNLPNILSGSSTGTGARTETGELGGKKDAQLLIFYNVNLQTMGGGLISLEWGNCPYARISWTLLVQLHLSTTVTPPLMEIKALANPVTASSRRVWLPLYLMSFISIFLMQMLNGIYLHFSVKRVSLIGLHLVTLHKS